jgi:hypothetical protein
MTLLQDLQPRFNRLYANIQSGMGLHLRGRGLQLSPPAEFCDASDVSQCRAVPARLEKDLQTPADATKTLPFSHNNRETWPAF